jgi:hypothetical protein
VAKHSSLLSTPATELQTFTLPSPGPPRPKPRRGLIQHRLRPPLWTLLGEFAQQIGEPVIGGQAGGSVPRPDRLRGHRGSRSVSSL